MKKILGIFLLLVAVMIVTTIAQPSFVTPYNLQNVIRWSAMFAILGVGVAFVIITGGIDLSIGSLVGLTGCMMPLFLIDFGIPTPFTVLLVVGVALLLGLVHGLLITKAGLQPFVVTLCGLLIYRGVARWITSDRTMGFGSTYDDSLRLLATGKPFSIPLPFVNWISEGNWHRHQWDFYEERLAVDDAGQLIPLDLLGWVPIPAPFLILVVLGILAAVFLNKTIWGRYLLALGRNEDAARYSGINTDRMVILAYVICSGMAGIGGILFTLDGNSVQPSGHGNFYELYAIAAAVLGGCSLRGGEGSIVGVVIGAAIMRVLYNSINILGIPSQLEFAIIGAVILIGVFADEQVKRLAARKRALRQAELAEAPG